MPEAFTRSDPSLLPIERPRFPKCRGRMMLARIQPGPNGSELRTFECPKCEHILKTLVEGPLKSAKRRCDNSRQFKFFDEVAIAKKIYAKLGLGMRISLRYASQNHPAGSSRIKNPPA